MICGKNWQHIPTLRMKRKKLEYFLHARGHACMFLQKYHCEMNPIERCWAQAKRYTRAYCNYNITGLRQSIYPALDSVSITNYFRRAKNYMYGYLLGHQAGLTLEKLVANYSKEFKSHRRISEVVTIKKILSFLFAVFTIPMLVFAYASVKFGIDIIVSVVVLTCLVKPIDYHMNGAITIYMSVAVVLSKYLINGIGYHGNVI